MYTRKLSQSFIPTGSSNLKKMVSEKCCHQIISNYSLIVKRHFSKCQNVNDLKNRLQLLMGKVKVYRQMLFSKESPEKTLKVWARQFEFVFAQRVRRGQQMFCHYSRWWEERTMKEFLRRFRMSLTRNGKEFIMGAMGVSLYNWEENRIEDKEFESHLDDLKYIYVLKDETMCLKCELGQKSDKNLSICECGTSGVTDKTYDDWVPFIEKDDLIVWRRPHGDQGLYEYKVYGSYHDVTAEDFLNVQVDTDYRREWDQTAVQLEVGEKDPQPDSNGDILYWEMQWPRLFVNRDYVFNRRYKVFEETKIVVIINKTTEYPRFPKYPDKFRVEEYWSCMVIKPYKDVNEQGIEFSLTYFDNPGVNIPSSVQNWVAKSAMPDYLARLRFASKNYRDYCLKKGTSKACEVYQQIEKERREQEEKDKLEYCSNDRIRVIMGDIFEEFQRKAKEKFTKKCENIKSGSLENKVEKTTPTEEEQLPAKEQSPANASNNAKQINHRFWKYLHPLYYFT